MLTLPSFAGAAPVSPASLLVSERTERATTSKQEALHDATLVQRFNAGDDSAFTEIISRYRGKMFAVALALLKNYGDAEEIAQDTFIRAHRALGAFRGDSSLATWLHRITVNLSRNRYWHFFRRRRHLTQSIDRAFSDDNTNTFADVLASESPDAVRETTMNEFSALIDKCLGQLSPDQREILTRRAILNLSYDEIGTALGINIGTVKSRIARARGSLRGLITAECPEFTAEMGSSDWFEPVRPRRFETGST
jgi:RNA polymerase sigma-70 factor (ECF subfamily)